jgi:hypothetical protein
MSDDAPSGLDFLPRGRMLVLIGVVLAAVFALGAVFAQWDGSPTSDFRVLRHGEVYGTITAVTPTDVLGYFTCVVNATGHSLAPGFYQLPTAGLTYKLQLEPHQSLEVVSESQFLIQLHHSHTLHGAVIRTSTLKVARTGPPPTECAS